MKTITANYGFRSNTSKRTFREIKVKNKRLSTGFHIEMKLYDLIITVLTVGIFEEGVFRGWFLNAIAGFTSKRRANLISSAMFVLIHYPSWIFHGNDISTIISVTIPMYGLSLIFGWAFTKNRSIWTGTIFHSFWDLLSFIM